MIGLPTVDLPLTNWDDPPSSDPHQSPHAFPNTKQRPHFCVDRLIHVKRCVWGDDPQTHH